MIKCALLIIAAIGIGLFGGWLSTKIYKINEKAAREAKETLEKEFWG